MAEKEDVTRGRYSKNLEMMDWDLGQESSKRLFQRGDKGTPPRGGVTGGRLCAWEGPFQGRNNAVLKW